MLITVEDCKNGVQPPSNVKELVVEFAQTIQRTRHATEDGEVCIRVTRILIPKFPVFTRIERLTCPRLTQEQFSSLPSTTIQYLELTDQAVSLFVQDQYPNLRTVIVKKMSNVKMPKNGVSIVCNRYCDFLPELVQFDTDDDSEHILKCLSGCTKLERLYLDNNKSICELELSQVPQVKHLNLQGCHKIRSLKELGHLKHLVFLNMCLMSEQVSLDGLQHCTKIEELYVNGQISDLTPLKHCLNLTHLSLNSTVIDSLEPLLEHTSLKQVNLLGFEGSVEPLQNCKALELYVRGKRVNNTKKRRLESEGQVLS